MHLGNFLPLMIYRASFAMALSLLTLTHVAVHYFLAFAIIIVANNMMATITALISVSNTIV